MNILLGYGYNPGTTGTYVERSVERAHRCFYVGTAWGTKRGYGPSVDLVDVVAALESPPDLFLYVDSASTLYMPRGLDRLACPTAAYLIDVNSGPKLRAKQLPFFDYVFVAQKRFAVELTTALRHPQVHWLPLACDPEIHRDLDLPRVYDVGFVGNFGKGIYSEREQMLETLARRYKTNDFRRSYDRPEMAQVYSQSKIVFNKSGADDLNMRVFEAMSCGALLLTDRLANGQDDLLVDREHYVTYRDKVEMLALAEYYLEHEDERRQIAATGRQLVRSQHTYDARLRQILDTVFGAEPCRAAPIRRRSAADAHAAYAELFAMVRLVDAVIDELTALRRMKSRRVSSTRQLLFALLRRFRYG